MEISLEPIAIELYGRIIELELADILPIDEAALSTEFANQPALYSYIGMIAANVEGVWLSSKRELERVKAQAEIDVRRDLTLNGEKVTDARIAAEVILIKGVQEAIKEELAARHQYSIMNNLVKAMEQRAQMLISLGAHQRQELSQTGMHLNETSRAPKPSPTEIVKDMMRAKRGF